MKKIGFVTCVRLGLSCIEEIYRVGGKLDVLFTLEDEQAKDKAGRIYLDDFARRNGIPLIKVRNINDAAAVEEIRRRELDWLFIIGWSQIAHKEVLGAPKFGCIGMHPTLLPKGRGRASVPWAILKGLTETGVTMFRLDEGVDTGDIIAQQVIPLDEDTTAAQLYGKVNDAHIRLIHDNWESILNGTVTFRKQDEAEATEWPGRRPEDGRISCEMTVKEALRLVRAVTHPYPGAFYEDDGKTLVIWSAEEGDEKDIPLADGWIRPKEYEIHVRDRNRYEKKEQFTGGGRCR